MMSFFRCTQMGPKPVKYSVPSAQGARLSLEKILAPFQQLAGDVGEDWLWRLCGTELPPWLF